MLAWILSGCFGVATELETARIGDTELRLEKASERVLLYQMQRGKCPESLRQLGVEHRDAWGNPMVVEDTGAGCEVVSYGANGAPGGWGVERDLRR